MNIIPVVFAFDNNLILPACVCISSLMMHAKKDTFYDIFILHSKKIELQREQLDKIPVYYPQCRIQYRTVGDCFDNAFEIRGITQPTYYRLLIPKLIPEYEKVIYSDVDVIFRDDFWNIYNTNIDNYYMAGVDNGSALRPSVQMYVKKSLGIDCKYGHFYAGNLLINCALIKADNVIEKFCELAQKEFRQQDMDIINIVCYGRIKTLPPMFCLTNYLTELIIKNKLEMLKFFTKEELLYALTNGTIHYNGQKPWKGYCINFDIWWEYYRKSPFFDERYYFDFFYGKLNELDQLSLWKRIKILVRYFVYGKRELIK